MIKPTELRLGNWIKKYESGWDFKQVTASDIAELEATPPHAEDMRFQPITLSPELLIKCGFDYSQGWDGMWIYKKYSVQLDDALQLVSYEQSPLEHLHQLQNLYFSLTGEELQINL